MRYDEENVVQVHNAVECLCDCLVITDASVCKQHFADVVSMTRLSVEFNNIKIFGIFILKITSTTIKIVLFHRSTVHFSSFNS